MANLSTAISGIGHLKAFDDLAKARLENIDISVLLMYVVDKAPVEALPYLAEQFDVLGFKGWALVDTEEEKRALIKKAIELHRYKGTEWAVVESIKTVGFENAEVKTAIGIDYNGDHIHDGSITYSGGHWANFRVLITLPDNIGVDEISLSDVTSLILQYKNARSRLIDVSFRIEFNDSVSISDEFLELDGDLIVDQVGPGINYNNVYKYDGSQNHDRLREDFELKIYNQFGELIE